MIVSFIIALYFAIVHPVTGLPILSTHIQLVVGIVITTVCWVAVTFLTSPTDQSKLIEFYRLTRPGGPGWKPVLDRARDEGVTLPDEKGAWTVPSGILAMILGTAGTFAILFGTENLLYGNMGQSGAMFTVAFACGFGVVRLWRSMAKAES